MSATRVTTEDDRRWLWRYLLAAHAARVIVAGFALYVAVRTTDEIPVAGRLSVVLAGLGVIWTLTLALAARPVDRLLQSRPRLVWVDSWVLLGLSLLDKPWDAMVAVPFGCFLLLVVYGSPRGILILMAVMAVAQYVPRLTLEIAGWRYADLCPPIGTGWFTAYVGPVFAGTICWALCVLVRGVRRGADEHAQAEQAVTEARVRRAEARARRELADHLHAGVSQVARAIPLMLGAPEPPGLTVEQRALRRQIAEQAARIRPAAQLAARILRADQQDQATDRPH